MSDFSSRNPTSGSEAESMNLEIRREREMVTLTPPRHISHFPPSRTRAVFSLKWQTHVHWPTFLGCIAWPTRLNLHRTSYFVQQIEEIYPRTNKRPHLWLLSKENAPQKLCNSTQHCEGKHIQHTDQSRPSCPAAPPCDPWTRCVAPGPGTPWARLPASSAHCPVSGSTSFSSLHGSDSRTDSPEGNTKHRLQTHTHVLFLMFALFLYKFFHSRLLAPLLPETPE